MAPVITLNVHKGQRQALLSEKRVVLLCAGTGGGKSTIGPPWLLGEIQKFWFEPPDRNYYLVAAPTTKLLRVAWEKLVPYLKPIGDPRQGEGRDGWKPSENIWYLKNGAQIRFGSVDNPGAIEGVHYRAAWCDEWGQVDDYQNSTVRRRLAFFKGRWLITTTPYPEFTAEGSHARTWLRTAIDEFRAGIDPEIDVIIFPSWWNPEYPLDELERIRRQEPPWRFAMFHEGKLTRPSGAIYGIFDESVHVIPVMPLHSVVYEDGMPKKEPHECEEIHFPCQLILCDCKCETCAAAVLVSEPWPTDAGMDFGGTNPTAILWGALSPDDVLYIYGERFAPNKTMESHEIALGGEKRGEPLGEHDGTGWGPERPDTVWADPSGKTSILDLNSVAIQTRGADNDVEEGIRAVWERLATGRLYIFQGRCPNLLREIELYRRGDNGKPVKEDDHALDALRYLCMGVKRAHRVSRVEARFVA